MHADEIDPQAQAALDGVDTRYVDYESMVHGFMTLRDVDRACDAIADDLTDALRND